MAKADHWLYKVVPPSWDDTNLLTMIPWNLFGNDEGGIFGEEDPYYTHSQGLRTPDISFLGFVKWWFRNPFHNLFFHTLKWDAGDNALVLYGCDGVASMKWFRGPQRTWLVDRGKQLQIRLLAPFISYRGTTWEFYAGWRIHGALGFAFRKHHQNDSI